MLLLHHTAAYDEEAYQAMERGVKAGKIHSIGLSNFYEDVPLVWRLNELTSSTLLLGLSFYAF